MAILQYDTESNFYGMECIAKAIGQSRIVLSPPACPRMAGTADPLSVPFQLTGTPLVPVALNSGAVSAWHIFSRWTGVIPYAVQPEIETHFEREVVRERAHDAIKRLND